MTEKEENCHLETYLHHCHPMFANASRQCHPEASEGSGCFDFLIEYPISEQFKKWDAKSPPTSGK
jgi:hypothetical protein